MSNGKRILVIDDDRQIAMGMTTRLRALGYDVSIEHDGVKGLSRAIADLPDAILCDIRMPGLDGLTVLSKLREHATTKSIPVVIVSASLVDQSHALDAGAQFFLEKPYQSKALQDILASVLNKQPVAAIDNKSSKQS